MTDFGVAVGEVPEREQPVRKLAIAVPDDPYQGFESWYLAAWPRLQRMLAAYCGSTAVATEVAAAAMVIAVEHWADSSRRPRNPDAWVAHVAFNLLKRHRYRVQRERDAMRVAPDHTSPERDLDLWAAVGRLPPRMRQAMVLRYLGDFTQPMVAEAMGMSTGYVASLLSRARQRIDHDTTVGLRPHRSEPDRT